MRERPPSQQRSPYPASIMGCLAGLLVVLFGAADAQGVPCTIEVPAWPSTVSDVHLSATCPAHSDACSGPTDPLPYQEKLSPCCHAHDWCYICGYKAGLWGIEGRRQCDKTFRQNMANACGLHFHHPSQQADLEDCVRTAETMYAAVWAYQETARRGLDTSKDCPGDSYKLAHASFCFNPVYRPASDVVATVSPGNGGKWGAWAALAKCPDGSWASAVATRVEPRQGAMADDTALNAVRMHCTDASGAQTTTAPLESHGGLWGDWSGFAACPAGAHIVGIKAQVEPQSAVDDTASNGFAALCSDGAELYNGNSPGWGWWSAEWARCPAGTAVCGFRVKFEQEQVMDDTAMNDIEAYCCAI